MTVKELIHKLKYYDPNAEVVYKETAYNTELEKPICDMFPTDNQKGDKFVVLLSDTIGGHNGTRTYKP